MPEDSFRFFRNEKCRYFPCHENIDPANFNCLFCYCPLYWAIDCGGTYTLTKDGKKNCTSCTYPHEPQNYPEVNKKLARLLNEKTFPENGMTIYEETKP